MRRTSNSGQEFVRVYLIHAYATLPSRINFARTERAEFALVALFVPRLGPLICLFHAAAHSRVAYKLQSPRGLENAFTRPAYIEARTAPRQLFNFHNNTGANVENSPCSIHPSGNLYFECKRTSSVHICACGVC